MAESASAFFAKKKKGKKPIKSFNANKLDASSISLGVGGQNDGNNEMNSSAAGAIENYSSNTKTISSQINTIINDEWEDATPYGSTTATTFRNNKTSGTSELLDMRALQQKRLEQDDVAERLRIEETKAALQKAKQGMEREAKRLEEERATAAAVKASSSTTSRFAGATTTSALPGAATTTTTVGDKWIPPNKRGLTTPMPRVIPEPKGSMFHYQRKLDVQDEEAFPDLASADKLLSEAKEKAVNRPKKPTFLPAEKKERVADPIVETTPSLPKQQDEDIFVEKPAVEVTVVEEPEVAVAIATSSTEDCATAENIDATPEAVLAPAEEKISSTTAEEGSNAALLKKKKKKKDISSFKVGG